MINLNINPSRLVKSLGSLKITVACLIWLMILTFWGTVAQVDDGLFWAQKRFFTSWVFFAADVLPLPGGQLTLWILFINLCAALMTRFRLNKNTIGLWLIHIGLLSYFVSAFALFHTMKEYRLTLWEGETKSTVEHERSWEVAAWPWRPQGSVSVTAYDVPPYRRFSNQFLSWPAAVTTQIAAWYDNATAMSFPMASTAKAKTFNDSGIDFLEKKPAHRDPNRNTPGILLQILEPRELHGDRILLYGAETTPTIIPTREGPLAFQLRKQNRPLPFRLTLEDVTQILHPHTNIAKSYRSELILSHDDIDRRVIIEMNRPLRYKEWTVYQAGYGHDPVTNREFSTFSVVKNRFALWPYVSFAVTSLGLAVHFLNGSFRKRMAV